MKKVGLILPAGVTPEMVAQFKEKYGDANVKKTTLEGLDGNELTIIVSVPNRYTRGQFERWIDKDPKKAREILIKACVLTEKDAVNGCDKLYESAVTALVDLFPIGRAVTEDL